jgi:hypothetical protein
MKRSISILVALGLFAALAVSPLRATAAPKPSIKDPAGDANFINDQGTGDGSFGDFETGADGSSFADLLSVTFTNNKKSVSVHIETESTGQPAAGEGFRVRVNPDGPGGIYCLNFEVFFNGAQNDMTEWKAHLRDACAADQLVEGKAGLSTLLAGIMITIPRKGHDALGKGKALTAPQAQSFLWSGSYPTGVAGPYLDTTQPGTDYKLKK